MPNHYLYACPDDFRQAVSTLFFNISYTVFKTFMEKYEVDHYLFFFISSSYRLGLQKILVIWTIGMRYVTPTKKKILTIDLK